MRPLSYSQISLYQTCPLQYKFQYIDGLKPKDKWYFSFGTVLHSCAEFFFRLKVPPPPTLEQLIQFYEQNWLSAGYDSPEEEQNYKAFGKEILAEFWKTHTSGFKMPLAVEQMFNIDIEGIKLRGFIDRVDKLDSGGISIVDYKSSKELFTADHLEKDLQLTLYQLAAEQLWHLPVEKLTLYHLRSNTPVSCQPRTEARLGEARKLVLETASGISEGKFEPTENDYCPCDFGEHCPYYRQKFVEILAQPRALDILRGMTIEEAVKRYVSLQSQIKELQLQFDDIKQMVTDFCQSEGLNRIYGKENAITYRMVERTGFEEDGVRALLEPEGLWQRVLSLDPALVKEMIADEKLAKDIREKLLRLRKVTSRFPVLMVKRVKEEE